MRRLVVTNSHMRVRESEREREREREECERERKKKENCRENKSKNIKSCERARKRKMTRDAVCVLEKIGRQIRCTVYIRDKFCQNG